MRLAGFVVLCLCAGRLAAADRDSNPPEILYQELFAAVAESSDPDSRTLATAIPLQPPAEILAQYRAEKPATPEALKAFVAAHFRQPEEPQAQAVPAGLPLDRHIDALWDVLTRHAETEPDYGSLLPLPHPYVVPGGRFVELYYWDSYFTLLGLQASGRHDLAQGMVDDFAYIIDSYGHIPNGSRSYYLSRSQPPFFFKMAELADYTHPARYLPQLKKEYAFWMEGPRAVTLPDGSVLNRYWDDRDTPRDEAWRKDTALAKESGREPALFYRDIRAGAESGWDFSSRWFEDGRHKATVITSEILPVDLNSLMFGLEQAILTGCAQIRDEACAKEFAGRAERRRAAMDRYFWSATDGAYYDYRWSKGQPIARLTAATFAPLFVHAASAKQAAAIAQ
ncbi:MAG TPA: trehalase family glycosidase, partial [Magnetospirillaceae bacterium]|nr:trehalase family glycosidase [Magnetospirillaceae bacterium]